METDLNHLSRSSHLKSWALYFLLAVPLVLAYLPIIPGLLEDYKNDPDSAHGILVPFICLWLVWRKRRELARLPIRPSVWGVPILVFGVLLYEICLLGHLAAGYRVSLVIVVWGVVLSTLGGKWTRSLAFPIFFLLFLIPFPEAIRGRIADPLQHFASSVSAWMLEAVFGIPVVRSGNILSLPNTDLGVERACSGIRSIIAYLMLGALFSHLRRFRPAGSLILISVAVPIALAANVGRVVASGILASFDPELATGFLHEFSGMVLFAIGFAVFLLLSILLKKRFPGFAEDDTPPEEADSEEVVPPPPPKAATIGALVFLFIVAGATHALIDRPQVEVVNPEILREVPMSIDDWAGQEARFSREQQILEILDPTESYFRFYHRKEDRVGLYVGYYGTAKGGRSSHNPRSCYQGAGFKIIHPKVLTIQPEGWDHPVEIEHLTVENPVYSQEVFFWYQTGGKRVVIDGIPLNLLRFWRGVTENRNDGAFIRVTATVDPENPEKAYDLGKEFSETIIPILAAHWPTERDVE